MRRWGRAWALSAAAVVGTLVLLAAGLTAASGASTAVSISGFAFNPPTLNVAAGTQVTWTNNDSGVPHSVTSDTGVFDSSPNCPTSGCLQTGNAFSFTFNTAGTFPYHCRVHSFMTGQVVVSAAPAVKLAITSAALTATARPAPTIGPITVAEQTASGTPAPAPAGGTRVTLSSSSAKASFSATSGGATSTAVTIPAGASSTTFFYGDAAPGTPTITTTASGLTAATQHATITAPATKLVITSVPFTAAATSAPTTGITISLESATGTLVKAPAGGVRVSVSSTSTRGVFSATPRGATTTAVTMAAGAQAVVAYYGDPIVGRPTITVTSPGLTGAHQQETIVAPATRLAITSAARSATATATPTIGPIVVALQSATSTMSVAPFGGTRVTFTSTSSRAVFSATSRGATTTALVIPAGRSSINVFYGDPTPGTPTITVISPGLSPASQKEAIH